MSKPSSYSSSRLDLTGENVADLTKKIATNQPVLAWLHSSEALALYNDPYINAVLTDPVGAVARIYALKDQEGQQIGRQYLNSLYQDELGHEVVPEDLIMIGGQFFSWLEKKITGFRGLEMVRYLSAADSAEKLIAGSLIKESIEASEKHDKPAENVDTSKQPKSIRDQLETMKKDQLELYALLLEQLRRATTYQEPQGSDSLQVTPYSSPVLGEIESGGEDEEQEAEVGAKLSRWLKERRSSHGILEHVVELLKDHWPGRREP